MQNHYAYKLIIEGKQFEKVVLFPYSLFKSFSFSLFRPTRKHKNNGFVSVNQSYAFSIKLYVYYYFNLNSSLLSSFLN